ncbi:MAG: LamG-like jellyroll fold domain-containing protein [Acidimicrobiales bacterium]
MLVEMLVALLILGIVLTMTTMIVVSVTSETANTVRLGAATESAQVTVANIDQYIRGVVSPADAAGEAGISLTNSGAPCWGSSSPAPPGGATITTPQDLAITTGYAFEMVFCGYRIGTDQASLYEITLTDCTPGAVAGYCTLEVIDWGPHTNPNTISAYSPTLSSVTPPAQVVAQVSNIWCNSSCQQYLVWQKAPSSTPPGLTMPGLFSYYNKSGGELGGPLDLTSTSSASDLSSVMQVTFNVTILANTNSALPALGGKPGTQISDETWLVNQLNPGFNSNCLPDAVLSPPDPTTPTPRIFYQLNDTDKLDDNRVVNTANTGTSYDGTAVRVGNGWDQTPGPSGCNPGGSGGSMEFNGNTYVTTALPETYRPGELTVAAWVKFSSFAKGNPRIVANTHTDSNYTGFQLVVNGPGASQAYHSSPTAKAGSSGFFDVGNGSAAEEASWANVPLKTGQWYFIVGTYDGTTTRAYIDGSEVASSNVEWSSWNTPTTTAWSTSSIASPSATGCPTSPVGPTLNVAIGYNPCYSVDWNTDFVEGDIADVAIYSPSLGSPGGVLSGSQILYQYQQATS